MYTYAKAKQYGLVVRPSSLKHKKIDVFKEGFKIASVGDDRYSDYPTMAMTDPQFAEKRRQCTMLAINPTKAVKLTELAGRAFIVVR